ncbi:hypothetical protein F2Q69_00014778 [Brassica cretica]|uniref:Uncharacterized protein n=1 Tax=Brassica cretica TaxID=69181 RepID=A0A8S9R440_BRACR|nr:hypothetical protein F2Q69_00014778 [Brassica cretica]
MRNPHNHVSTVTPTVAMGAIADLLETFPLVALDWMWSSGKSPADRCTTDRKIKSLESWNQNSIVLVTTALLWNSIPIRHGSFSSLCRAWDFKLRRSLFKLVKTP